MGARKSVGSKKTRTKPGRRRAAPRKASVAQGIKLPPGLVLLPLWLLVLLAPLVFSPTAADSFRLPKLLLSEVLGLLSLLPLAWRLRTRQQIAIGPLLRQPVILVAAPILVVASLSLLTSDHQAQVREGLASLWIALICLVGWTLGLHEDERRRLLRGLIFPAVVLALFGAYQFHIENPFAFAGQVEARVQLTSLAGSAFDLAAYLLLPCLIAQAACLYAAGARRWWWAAAAVLCGYGVALSQTLTALVALALASLVLWFQLLPRRRFLAAASAVAAVSIIAVLAVAPLRSRVQAKLTSLTTSDLNETLTGRLDGWRTALWMVRTHPVFGVGHGAYRAEFAYARLALMAEGVPFYRQQHQVFFSNAHNDYLDAAAEWGLLGVAALLFALAVLLRSAFVHIRREREGEHGQAALIPAGLCGLALLALTGFPFHLGLIAYPALLFLSGVLAVEKVEEGAP